MSVAWERLYDWFIRGADPRLGEGGPGDDARGPGTGSAQPPGDADRKVEARRSRSRTRAAVVCLATVAALTVAVADGADAKKKKLPVEQVYCGQTIDHSIRVANNLEGCADGLVVGADGIKIDLGGHRIAGTGVGGSVGIDNTAGHRGVKIRNGIVQGFEIGVYLSGAENNVISGLHVLVGTYGLLLGSSDGNAVKNNTVLGNTIEGIRLFSSSGNELVGNTSARNIGVGIMLTAGSDDNTLEGNATWANANTGIRVGASSRNVLKGNTSSGNQDGFDLHGPASDNVFTGNTASGNRGDGVSLSLASGNSFKGNTAKGNDGHGVFINSSPSNTLKGNDASANDDTGIHILSSPGGVLVKNKAHENGANGIWSDTAALTLMKNAANRNGFLGGPPGDGDGLGIDVPEGTINSGNTAVGNDDADECSAPDVDCQAPAEETTKLQTELVFCGQTIDHSLRVANNLLNCVGDGLVIGADDITIDLGGHRIDGGAGVDGIDNTAGHSGVKIRNGIITGFDRGVHLVGATNNVISGLLVTLNGQGGVVLEASMNNALKGNQIWVNGGDGVSLDTSTGNTLKGNEVAGATFNGISLSSSDDNVLKANDSTMNRSGSGITVSNSDGNTFKGNTTWCNATYGIELFSSDDGVVTSNTASCNVNDGIRISRSMRNTLTGNVVTGNDDFGVFLDTLVNTTLKRNTVSANDLTGIRISGGLDLVLVKNKAHENGSDGISSSSADVTFKKNAANGNGFLGGPPEADGIGLGIDVPAGTTNAGNKAKGNDDPHQCQAADVTSCHVP